MQVKEGREGRGQSKRCKIKQKPAKVHELKAQMTAGMWLPQPYTEGCSAPPKRGPWGVMFCHIKTVQVKSLNKQEDNKHIRPLKVKTCPKVQVHKFDCEVDTGPGCNIMPLYIYRSIFGDQKPEPSMMIITGCGDSPVPNTGLCTSELFIGYQAPRKAVFQVTYTRGYLILSRETVRKIGYIYLPIITLPKLTQQPKMHAHLTAIRMKTSVHDATTENDRGL